MDWWHQSFFTKVHHSWLEELYVLLVLFCRIVSVSLTLWLLQHWRKLALSCDLTGKYIWTCHIVFLLAWLFLVSGFLWRKFVSWQFISDQVEISLLWSLNLGNDFNILIDSFFFLIFNSLFKFPKSNLLQNGRIQKFFCWRPCFRANFEAQGDEII